ncbi:trehalose synthase complex regulatory subunit Tps3p [[Candida] jaroonii]|uniref:Trehalose synthase complex regulatory subunit Tps3p n=1 Tax=[Candida] jaroonii TaxID=467808 RepID=A0ACA9YFN7_9ASCO|nr:trehalose synthase complex regulatory subunit Tps3p [[Candida] jaroonii]
MTVIIGSLFLPYTVQFEVGPQDSIPVDEAVPPQSHLRKRSSGTGVRPMPIRQSSILPSLSIANSHQQSPTSTPKPHEFRRRSSAHEGGQSVEDFFLKRIDEENNKEVGEIFAENLKEKLLPQYIQPKSKINVKDGSVVDLKKVNDDLGLPALKISRSDVNLSSFAPTPVNSRALASLNRSGGLMSLSNNSSQSLIDPITEEEPMDAYDSDTNDWDNDFNDMINPRTVKLAPFGGFSNPKLESGILSQSNIFETSPWKVLFAATGNGSLIKAVKTAAENDMIRKRKWVGTLAMPTDEVPQRVINDISKTLSEDYYSEPVFPSDSVFAGHYKSFCKQLLWPTLHYEIPDNPKSKAFEDHSWGHYKALNQLMADKLVEVYLKENKDCDADDDENIIWIHDYHLLLVPQMVREKLPHAKIGLFLHVSFPSSEVFRCLAQREALLKGMLGANVISFQTDEYVRHFLQTCSRLLLTDTNEYGLTYDGRFTMVNSIPVGIDANALGGVVDSDNVNDWRQRIRHRWNNQKLIMSRDKLDKLRGIKEKLLAYELFLKTNPEFVDNTVLIQICTGGINNDDYFSQIMSIVTRINSLAENISNSLPVVLLQQDIGFDQYLALQAEAEVFVVSSMREGLNLTCHEFIIATTERKSPLILSEFTGSSQMLDINGKGALLINPWDMKHFSEVFKHSLTMEPDEKLLRWRNCHDVVVNQDYKFWIKNCLSTINEAWAINHTRNTQNVTKFDSSIFKQFYNNCNNGKKLFVFNLETASALTHFGDGKINVSATSATTSSVKNSDMIPPSRLHNLLNDVLLNDDKNFVFISSYLKRSTLDTMFKRFPKFGLVAENGGYIKFPGTKTWLSLVDDNESTTWISQVKPLVEAKVERLPGSKMEIEDCTIIFNPGISFTEDKQRSIDLMGDLIQHVNELFSTNEGVHASLIWNTVIIQQNQLSIRALNFLVNHYNHQSSDFTPKEVNDSVASTPVKEKKFFDKSHLTGVFLSGGATLIDEPCYELAKELFDDKVVANVLTVAAISNETKATSARYGVAGRNELLSLISTSSSTKGR